MTYRNEKLRRYVASMPCVHCGSIDVQAAHRNQGKGIGIKASDGLLAAICWREHARIDQGKDLTRAERRFVLDRYIVDTFRMAEMRADLDAGLMDEWRQELEKAGLLEVSA